MQPVAELGHLAGWPGLEQLRGGVTSQDFPISVVWKHSSAQLLRGRLEQPSQGLKRLWGPLVAVLGGKAGLI